MKLPPNPLVGMALPQPPARGAMGLPLTGPLGIPPAPPIKSVRSVPAKKPAKKPATNRGKNWNGASKRFDRGTRKHQST
jgi:hypothetical protein